MSERESPKTILLIGPMGAGKSTVAKLLAKRTKIPNVPIDKIRWYYYFKNGFSLERELEFSSLDQVQDYWKPFELKAVEASLGEFPNSIIDFGAGLSYYPDKDQLDIMCRLLDPYPNIFLLMPSTDPEKSLSICLQRVEERNKQPLTQDYIESNRNFIKHPSNYLLAKHTIYTENKSAGQVADEIAAMLVL